MSLYPEWRGMGIGSRLLDAMLRLAEGEGWKCISLSVQLDNFARGMYLKAGFEPVEVREDVYKRQVQPTPKVSW